MLPRQRLHNGIERGQALPLHGMAHHFGLLAHQSAAAWPCCVTHVLFKACPLLSGVSAYAADPGDRFVAAQDSLSGSMASVYSCRQKSAYSNGSASAETLE
jgi:hypothetical protein